MEFKSKEFIDRWVEKLQEDLKTLRSKPKLTILIAKDFYEPSKIYTNNKKKMGDRVGVDVNIVEIEWEGKSKKELRSELIHHIYIAKETKSSVIVQVPFPQLTETEISELIPPEIDVDGFTTIQKGKLVNGDKDALVPCTALGVMEAIKWDYEQDGMTHEGRTIAILSRSNLIGKPLLQLALQNNMTPTVMHTKTKRSDKESIMQSCSVVVTGCGQRAIFNSDDFYVDTELIIDCSMEKKDGRSGVGDCDKEDILRNLPYITVASGYGNTGSWTCLALTNNVIQAHKQNNW